MLDCKTTSYIIAISSKSNTHKVHINEYKQNYFCVTNHNISLKNYNDYIDSTVEPNIKDTNMWVRETGIIGKW